jgi:hypothetical protein
VYDSGKYKAKIPILLRPSKFEIFDILIPSAQRAMLVTSTDLTNTNVVKEGDAG